MCSMCESTVRLDRKSRPAISRLPRPSATRPAISRSRRVSGFAARRAAGPGADTASGEPAGTAGASPRAIASASDSGSGGAVPQQRVEPLLAERGARRVGGALADLGVGRAHEHRRVQQRPQRVAGPAQHGGALEVAGAPPGRRRQVEAHRDRVQVAELPP